MKNSLPFFYCNFHFSYIALLWLLLLPGCASHIPIDPIRDAEVTTVANRAADWQLAHMDKFDYVRTFRDHTENPHGWIQCAFFCGSNPLGRLLPKCELPECSYRKRHVPETSGTGFMTFGLAWGINNGLLDRSDYLPAVTAGWRGLGSAVDAEGKLGWVQQVGASPEKIVAEDTQLYGVGALLLAATEVGKLQNN